MHAALGAGTTGASAWGELRCMPIRDGPPATGRRAAAGAEHALWAVNLQLPS